MISTSSAAGGAGYDFQDIYVAIQLAKLLVGDRDRPVEVLWEKKALQTSKRAATEAVNVDDAIIQCESGKWIFVQVKQASPGKEWSAKGFIRSDVAKQFWNQWSSRSQADRQKTALRLATAAECRRLEVIVDVALRSRTTAELLSREATKETLQEIETIADGLGLPANSGEFLEFLKSLQVETLPAADELENWLIHSLAVFGASAKGMASRLIRMVARSKHEGPAASSCHTQASLVRTLLNEGVPKQTLMIAGLLPPSLSLDDSFWPSYRDKVTKAFRTLRVYGLDIEHAVYADLPSLFVPLKLARIDTDKEESHQAKKTEPKRRYLDEMLFDEEKESQPRDEESEDKGKTGTLDLALVLSEKHRIALIGGPGAGKTTTLKWCAVVSAMPGREGRAARLKFGLPADPLNPVYVRFRDFGRWVQANGLDGMEGKHGLVANFVAATFVRDFGDKFPTRMEAFTVASELLASEKTLFLFDGLDEVQDESLRNRLFASVANLLEEYKPPRVILSSRPYAFSYPHSQFGQLELFEPLPLNRQARRKFALQWYRAIKGHLGRAMTEKDAATRAEDLFRTAERVNDAAENPLLLSILALIHFNKNGLPVERTKIYDHATLAMLGHWDRSPSGRDLGENMIPLDWYKSLALSEPQIRQVVEYLAHRVQFSQADSEFQKQDAVQALAQGISRVGSPTFAHERAELLLRLLVERSGLLQERSPDVFAFTHLSFQEYLAARRLLAETADRFENIARASAEERHTEVVRFATAILAAHPEPEAKLKVLQLLPRIAEHHPSLAAACLLEAPGLSLEPTAAEDLARQVFQECSGRGRFYHRPRLVSRLIWSLLRQTQDPDRLLLEFLATGGEGHRHPMEDEVPIALLAGRPSGRPSPRLEWMLARLEKANNPDHYPVNPGKLARLILTEEGIEQPEANLLHLMELMDREDHFSGQIGQRAKRLLLLHLSDDGRKLRACQTILAGLRSPGGAIENSWAAWRIAQSMRALDLKVGPEFAEILVRHGFSTDSTRPECSLQVREFLKIPSARPGVLEALKTGLSNQNSDVRLECAKIMRELEIPNATPEHDTLTESSIRDTIEQAGRHCNWKPEESEEDWKSCSSPIQDLLRDAKTHNKAMSILIEKLWSRKSSEACFAGVMILEAGLGHTPGVIQALVNDGLSSGAWRAASSKYLKQLKLNPHTTHAVTAALTEGLNGRTDKVAADLSRKEGNSGAREESKKEDNAVATACAIALLEMGETKNPRLLSAILAASIRDADQANTVAAHILKLLDTDLRDKISKELAEFFADENMDAGVASAIATVLADTGCLDIPNLSRGLVLGGFWNEKNHARVSQLLLTMLQSPQFATDVRKALSEGLASDDAEVAWGAASFLCKHSERTDPALAGALILAGLNKDTRRPQAQTWLRELVTNPFTAPTALKVMHKAAEDGLDKSYSTTRKNPSLSWEVARCLLLEGKNEAAYLPDAIMYGARKPMFTVPNHMLGQFSSELLMLYPSANILAATKEDFEKDRRRELMSRIATGNWDAIIVTHSGFEKIPMSADTKHEFFREQLHDLELAILEQKAGHNNRRIVKDLERAKKRLETKLKTLVADEKKDNTLTFEELGVDRLFVDEAHYFKNLFYISKMTRIAGLPQTASERAFDMFLKVQYLQRTNGGTGVVFATGTPIANSVAKMYTMQVSAVSADWDAQETAIAPLRFLGCNIRRASHSDGTGSR